jgi:heme A synthase
MPLLAGFVILVSGYLGFAARREGKSLEHASLLASLSAAVLQAIVGGGLVWLSGTPLPDVIAPVSTAWALACAAALSGALAAGFCPVHEPIGCWHPWGTAA